MHCLHTNVRLTLIRTFLCCAYTAPDCWVLDFKKYVTKKGLPFPVPDPSQFKTTLKSFYDETKPKGVLLDATTGRVQAVSVGFYSQSNTDDYLSGKVFKMKAYWDELEAWVKAANVRAKATPGGVGGGFDKAFQTDSNGMWRAMATILNLQSSFYLSASLSFVLAFVIMIVSTMDLVLSMYALLCLLGSSATVVALMVWGGFTLGVLESICLSLLVGISVDYVAHLANAYVDGEMR